jgi:hypothetical protein
MKAAKILEASSWKQMVHIKLSPGDPSLLSILAAIDEEESMIEWRKRSNEVVEQEIGEDDK